MMRDQRVGDPLAVARYLRPEEQVVPFKARPELDELLSWCATEAHVAAQLVVGDGGAGKTRLSLQLGQEMVEAGWQLLWVPRGMEGEVVNAIRELETPCIAIVDYAETRNGLEALLNDVGR